MNLTLSEQRVQSGEPAGGFGGDCTTIDLRKPFDLNLVHRAVVNGWDVPQHVRDQICEQITPALEAAQRESNHTGRRAMRVIKLIKLLLAMDAWNLIDRGVPKSKFPYLRRRYPERRQRRTQR